VDPLLEVIPPVPVRPVVPAGIPARAVAGLVAPGLVAATLVVAGKAANLKDGVVIGRKSLDGGAAAKKLDHLIAISNA